MPKQIKYFSCHNSFLGHRKQEKLQIFNGHSNSIYGIKFSLFSCCKYLYSGSADKAIVYVMLKHPNYFVFSMDMKKVFCVRIFHHCKAITRIKCLWDIRSCQSKVFNGHKSDVNYVEYSPFPNIICSDQWIIQLIFVMFDQIRNYVLFVLTN
ncbi:hypothetical protein RFI_20271 [Reticulomyxa filosa]|uniref:Uncharacterized protein n=1 Tax=Reticulomyxa filosa TaxID=46433 RepID=X6MTA0_RETFI|nr:hypothetical protein RFI_20271 [Reticulomyxa filosa]|eukprot:ETO17064.1 hypothetical protein RFI_20271 [Reticulomyxa filosa]